MPRRWIPLSLAALATAMAVGCSSSADTEHGVRTIPKPAPMPWAPPPSQQVRELSLPFDRYQVSVNEIYYAEKAQDVLVRACMKRRGFAWPTIDNTERFVDLRNRRRYGVIEKDVAKALGYRPNPTLLGSTSVTARKFARDRALSKDQRAAAADPRTGCQVRAHRRLRAQVKEPDASRLSELSGRGLKQAMGSPAVRSALRAWRQCMADRGHRYADPYAASVDKRWGKGDRATRAEKSVAVADVLCKEKTSLVTKWAAAERAYQRQQIRKHPGYFADLLRAKDGYLDAARDVLERRRS
ncbi:hypothetical protein [Streptomyces sp. G45]|uniref:hypothetical protein n=1 Tax=Streptomyces sp. G45 TaxID=3406627 RepID=UPI003C1961A3